MADALRVYLEGLQVLAQGDPKLRAYLEGLQVLAHGQPKARVYLVGVQVLWAEAVSTYTLTVNVTGGGSVVLDPTGGVYAPSTDVDLQANPDPGWTFDHWEDDLSGSTNPETITMDADKTVTAVFVPAAAAANRNMMLGIHF